MHKLAAQPWGFALSIEGVRVLLGVRGLMGGRLRLIFHLELSSMTYFPAPGDLNSQLEGYFP